MYVGYVVYRFSDNSLQSIGGSLSMEQEAFATDRGSPRHAKLMVTLDTLSEHLSVGAIIQNIGD